MAAWRRVEPSALRRLSVAVLFVCFSGRLPHEAHAQGVSTAFAAYSGGVNLAQGQLAPLQVDANGNLLVDLAISTLKSSSTAAAALPVADGNSAAFQGVVPITPGAAVAAAPLRGIGFIVTIAGNATFTFADGSSLTIALQVAGGGFQSLPFAVTRVSYPASGAAVGSFWGLE